MALVITVIQIAFCSYDAREAFALMRCCHGHSQNFFQGGQRQHFAYLFRVDDDAIQMGFTKHFTPSVPHRKFPMKARTPFAPFLKSNQMEMYTHFAKGCTFCHPLQLLVNWGIFQ